MTRKTWTPEEDSLLQSLAGTCSYATAATHFPDRSKNSVVVRINRLGLKFPQVVWSPKEDELLREEGLTLSLPHLVSLFPGKTEQQVGKRRRELGVRREGLAPTPLVWSEEETQTLRALEGTCTRAEASGHFPSRNYGSVSRQIRKLGLQFPKEAGEPWSVEELALLRRLAAEEGRLFASGHLFPGRTQSAIGAKATQLGLKFRTQWTDEEAQLIRELGPTMSSRDLASHVAGKSAEQVRSKRARMGIVMGDEVRSAIQAAVAMGHANTRPIIDPELTLSGMDEQERSVFLGTLLGDGCVTRSRSCTAYRFVAQHGAKQKDFVTWKAGLLPSLHPRQYYSRTTEHYSFSTPSHAIFTDLRERMYDERASGSGKKMRAPDDVIGNLGWLGLLVWYLDDGGLAQPTAAKHDRLGGIPVIYSASLSREQLEHICALLKEQLGISLVVRGGHASGEIKRIVFNKETREVVLPIWRELARELSLPACMHYKLSESFNLRKEYRV